MEKGPKGVSVKPPSPIPSPDFVEVPLDTSTPRQTPKSAHKDLSQKNKLTTHLPLKSSKQKPDKKSSSSTSKTEGKKDRGDGGESKSPKDAKKKAALEKSQKEKSPANDSETGKKESENRHQDTENKAASKADLKKKGELTKRRAVNEESSQAHANPAFEVDDDLDVNTMGSKHSTPRERLAEKMLNENRLTNERFAERHSFSGIHGKKTGDLELGKIDLSTLKGHQYKKDGKLSDDSHDKNLDSNPDGMIQAQTMTKSSTEPQQVMMVEENSAQLSARKRRPLFASRLHARSDEDYADGHVGGGIAGKDLGSAHNRTQSLIERSRTGDKSGKSRRLLRDISFSDADARRIQNYGALKSSNALPRRQTIMEKQESLCEDEDEDDEEEEPVIPDEVVAPLLKLMKELVQRGKVTQVAVLDNHGDNVIVSYPDWSSPELGVRSLAKAVLGTQQMFKLFVNGELYSCFKHGPNKMVARASDHMVVGQHTDTAVVVARAQENTPGSCLYEVSEFAGVLQEKGW